MTPSQFYLTLPSNSSTENTAAIFTTTLPQNINLDGDWECALVEIIYPNSWLNVTKADNLIEFLDIEKRLNNKIKIPRGRYETADELISILNSSITFVARREKVAYNDYLKFSYIPSRRTIQLYIDTSKIKNLKFSKNIMYMLGFYEKDIETIDYSIPSTIDINAYYPADLSCGMSYLYIYCDVLEPQIIGTKLAPLLQVVNVEGKYTQLISRIYTSPHYVPILKKRFNSIEINIKNDQDAPVDFSFGKTIVKMHFRKAQHTSCT